MSGRCNPPPHAPTAAGGENLSVGDRETFSSHSRRGLADGEQRSDKVQARVDSALCSTRALMSCQHYCWDAIGPTV